jgi:peroxiredoxin
MKLLLNLTFGLLLIFSSTSFAGGIGVDVGGKAPQFELKNVDGKMVSLKDYAKEEGVIVIFSCNHCPYVKLYEDRINALDAMYKEKGYPVIAINSNDPKTHPGDSYEAMQERAEEKGFTFPYLVDETQKTAKAYGASRTPHVFLLKNNDGVFTVAYIGAIDNDTEGEMAKTERENYLENAISALQNGDKPDPSLTKAIGCTIKWRK